MLQGVEAMSRLEEVRRRASELLDKIPWQYIADSPTTRYYTDWKLFEELLSRDSAEEKLARQGTEFTLPTHDVVLGCSGNTDSSGGLAVYEYSGAPESYKRLFGSLLDPKEGKLVAAHYSKLDKAYIVVLRDSGFYSVGICNVASLWSSSHVVVVAEPGVEAALALDVAPSSNGTIALEVFVGEDARLELLTVTNPPDESVFALLSRRLVLERAKLVSASLHKASRMYRVEEETALASHSSYEHQGVAVAKGAQRIDYILDTLHRGPRSSSSIRAFGFALDSAFAAARGVASIAGEARKSRTSFEVEVLILGDEARGYTMPLLEIDTGDVEAASHHAAQYRVSRDQLFYMQSRGLDINEAVSLLMTERILSTVARLERVTKSLGEKSARLVEAMLA